MHASSVISAPATGERISVSSLYTCLSLSHMTGISHYHLGPLQTSTRETCLAVTYANPCRNATGNSRRAETKHTCKFRTNIISIRKDLWAGAVHDNDGSPGACADAVTDQSNYDDATFTPRLMITICLCAFALYFRHSSLLCHPPMDNPCISFTFG